jgi:hypothetical protein
MFEGRFKVGAVIRLRKKHPCGSDEWQVLSVGASIELQCEGCGKHGSFDPLQLRRLVRPQGDDR